MEVSLKIKPAPDDPEFLFDFAGASFVFYRNRSGSIIQDSNYVTQEKKILCLSIGIPNAITLQHCNLLPLLKY